MHGYGLLLLTNGDRFEGYFNDGIINGEGVYYTQDNNEVKGMWNEGVLIEVFDWIFIPFNEST